MRDKKKGKSHTYIQGHIKLFHKEEYITVVPKTELLYFLLKIGDKGMMFQNHNNVHERFKLDISVLTCKVRFSWNTFISTINGTLIY